MVNRVVELYESGQSEVQIAKTLKITRYKVRKLLHKAQVKIRTRQEATRLWCQQLSVEGRRARIASAHKANAENKTERTMDQKRNRALTVYTNQSGIQRRERMLANELQRLLPDDIIRLQWNIDAYNVDICLPKYRLVIELQKARMTSSPSMRPDRMNFIVGRGWKVIVCYSTQRTGYNYESLGLALVDTLNRTRDSDPGLLVLYHDGQPYNSYDETHFANVPKLKLQL